MKKIELCSMEVIVGGDYGSFVSGFCGGVGTAAAVLALTGVGAPAAVAALAYGGLACGVMSLFR
jgi:hypothetical protein